ncbi:DUF5819 family protein [Phytoactinopolyspora limicola]|uniref:DUF5819 family protein n=1 Tax=Phytoactinopolyspora limicola TaxID=2715536 RepID=UPI00140A203D|nr:DUF5819 family protein [Phytoactinopolyspora limicola]
MQQTRPAWLKFLAGVLGLAVGAHLAVTALFVGPNNAAKDSLKEPMNAYMLPMFQQNWSLFAPRPIGTERTLFVRGWYNDQRHTEWVNVTDLEIDAAVLHNLTPSRVGIVTRRAATRIGQQHARMTSEERFALASHYHHDAWDRLRARMMREDDRSPASRISYVLRYDQAITAYATQFAYAWWGEDAGVKYVQFKTEESRAPSFANRDRQPTVVTREFGRRPLIEHDGQDREAFAAAIERFAR